MKYALFLMMLVLSSCGKGVDSNKNQPQVVNKSNEKLSEINPMVAEGAGKVSVIPLTSLPK